jgi:hypothetical protein
LETGPRGGEIILVRAMDLKLLSTGAERDSRQR